MKTFTSSLSAKGQITIPLEFRRRLGLRPNDKVTIHLSGDVLTVVPIRSSLETIYQSVPALARPLSDTEMTRIAAEEHAAHAAREGLAEE